MRLPIAIALALAACGTEPDPKEDTIPGPSVVTTLCAAGCNAGVETAIVTSKWIQLSDDMFELAGEVDVCGGLAHSGSCADACNGGAGTQAAGGSCVAIACPTQVVIARCSL